MLSFLKREKSKKLENQLNTLQKEGPAAWADLPEDELFTPAGFHAEQAEYFSFNPSTMWMVSSIPGSCMSICWKRRTNPLLREK